MNTTACPFDVIDEGLSLRLTARDLGFAPAAAWNPSPSVQHRTSPYPLPVELSISLRGNDKCGSRYSPPPFAVVVQAPGAQALVQVAADAGWHRWNAVDFAVDDQGVTVTIDLEGQSDPRAAARHVRLLVQREDHLAPPMQLLAMGLAQAYPDAQRHRRDPASLPEWWLHPSYCGWGDQTTTGMDLEGVGPQAGAMCYCIQGLYERWLHRFDRLDVPVGTVILDAGWSPAGWWKPNEERWPDLRAFIDRQHQVGRRVVLWLATWLWDGLPDDWCLKVDGVKLTADPTHPAYREHLRQCVQELLSPDGYDADGFKIDQLSHCPSRRMPSGGPRFGSTYDLAPATHRIDLAQGELWGCELLLQLQRDIHTAAKQVKPDALITSSTVHPCFAGTFDMVRLHDMGEVAPDLFAAMQARADLAMAALPGMPIDADDWIHSDYDLWLRYTAGSGRLGVPCTFYAERFVQDWSRPPLTRAIEDDDLRRIARNWRQYLAQLPRA